MPFSGTLEVNRHSTGESPRAQRKQASQSRDFDFPRLLPQPRRARLPARFRVGQWNPKDGLPTGYTAEQTHPDIAARDEIIENSEALRVWLEKPA